MSKKIQITEKKYDFYNELDGYVNGTFDDDGSVVEKGIYGKKIYDLNAPIVEISKGKFKIVGYELYILDGVLFSKLQEELMSNGAL